MFVHHKIVVRTQQESNRLSEMPCHLIGDVHEGLTRSLLSLGRTSRRFCPSERTGDFQWETKTPLTFTAACGCDSILTA